VLDLLLHRFRNDIATVCPFFAPNAPSIAVAPSIAIVPYVAVALPSCLPRRCVNVAPSIAFALALSIADVAVALSLHLQ
jgi:hypothetical protein